MKAEPTRFMSFLCNALIWPSVSTRKAHKKRRMPNKHQKMMMMNCKKKRINEDAKGVEDKKDAQKEEEKQ